MKFDAERFGVFFSELADHGYHIFSRERARGGFYPNAFPSIRAIDITELNPNDRITIRAFFAIGKSPTPQVDSGYVDLEVEYVERQSGKVFANIITNLPAGFALSKGTTLELDIDEVLYQHHD